MSLEDIYSIIDSAEWFGRLGEAIADRGLVQINSLEAWRSDDRVADDQSERIAEAMTWLPSSLDGEDPFNGTPLLDELKAAGREREAREAVTAVQKAVLPSLRRRTSPLLMVPPHDFTNAAKGAAAYAARQAALESLVGRRGQWTELLGLYQRGHWPCGILPSGKIVVL
jgi:hypothetical protein